MMMMMMMMMKKKMVMIMVNIFMIMNALILNSYDLHLFQIEGKGPARFAK